MKSLIHLKRAINPNQAKRRRTSRLKGEKVCMNQRIISNIYNKLSLMHMKWKPCGNRAPVLSNNMLL